MREFFRRKGESVEELTNQLIEIDTQIRECLGDIQRLEHMQSTEVVESKPVNGTVSGQVFALPKETRGNVRDRIAEIARQAQMSADVANAAALSRFAQAHNERNEVLPEIPAQLEQLREKVRGLEEQRELIVEKRRKA